MRSSLVNVNKLLLKIITNQLPISWDFKISRSLYLCNLHYYKHQNLHTNMSYETGLSLKEVLEKLKNVANLSLAESWDNVGLLVEPSTPKQIKRIFLTNDLTEGVLDEAVLGHADFIIAYHPPIFVPIKSLTTKSWKERVIVKCIENRIAVFSPHTSYDSVQGGVTDWMASAFGVESTVVPLTTAKQRGLYTHLIEVVFPSSPAGNSATNEFQKQLRQFVGTCEEEPTCDLREFSAKDMKMSLACTTSVLPKVVNIFHDVNTGSEEEHLRITKYEEIPVPHCGSGRLCTLKSPVTVSKIVEKVKIHINRPHVRLALVPGKDMDSPVSTIAICVGSGTSVLRGVKADLYLTGEMLHHDVLDAVHNGSHVILCNHSDSERGFLTTLASRLGGEFQGTVEVMVSKVDKDPLETV